MSCAGQSAHPPSLITVAADARRASIRASGHLGAEAAATLRDAFAGHLDAGRRYLRLDLAEVTGLDRAVLDVVAAVHQEALALRGTLILTGVRAPVAGIMAATMLDRVLLVSGPRSDLDPAPESVAPSQR